MPQANRRSLTCSAQLALVRLVFLFSHPGSDRTSLHTTLHASLPARHPLTCLRPACHPSSQYPALQAASQSSTLQASQSSALQANPARSGPATPPPTRLCAHVQVEVCMFLCMHVCVSHPCSLVHEHHGQGRAPRGFHHARHHVAPAAGKVGVEVGALPRRLGPPAPTTSSHVCWQPQPVRPCAAAPALQPCKQPPPLRPQPQPRDPPHLWMRLRSDRNSIRKMSSGNTSSVMSSASQRVQEKGRMNPPAPG